MRSTVAHSYLLQNGRFKLEKHNSSDEYKEYAYSSRVWSSWSAQKYNRFINISWHIFKLLFIITRSLV
jgi:hypothetical protein